VIDAFSNSWSFLFAAFWLALAGVTSVHAILRRRDPRAALWWVAVSFSLPLVGAFLYYMMGINRIQRKASRMGRRLPMRARRAARVLSRASDRSGVSPRMRHLSSLAHLVDGIVGKPLTEGNSVRPLINGDEAYPAMIKAIDEAKESIGIATYIFNHDSVGKRFVEALARAVERGVEVRALIDGVGSGFGRTPVEKVLLKAGIRAAYFNPTLAPYRMAYLNLRNHRKILIVDGRIGFSGGINIHEHHVLGQPSAFPTQDIHFELEGPVVGQLQEVFRDDWQFVTQESLGGPRWFPKLETRGSVAARGIAAGPDEDYDKLRWAMLGALASAQHSVRIVTPYFIPDSSLITALSLAAMSGIRVEILLPAVSDLSMVKWASTAMLWQVLERGCRVWMTPAPFNHTKLLLVDGGWTLFGSSNWDTRSLRLNFEFDVECYDEDLTKWLSAWVDDKIKSAREVTLEDLDSRPFPIKLRDGIARLFSPHL